MSAAHPWASTDAPHSHAQLQRLFFVADAPVHPHPATSFAASKASCTAWEMKGNGEWPLSGEGDDRVGGDGGALTPTTLSGRSSPASATSRHGHDDDENKTSDNTESAGGHAAPVQPTSMYTRAVSQTKRHGRQWTPRQRSRSSGGESGVTTVRDWVQSTRCSPSKQPRSSSVSRRDSFVSSFASALVPQEAVCMVNGEEEEEESEARKGRFTSTATTARSDSESGLDWAGESLQAGQEQQRRMRSPQRTASWRQLRSHPGGASSRLPPAGPVCSPPSSVPATSLPSTPTLSRHNSWHGAALRTNGAENNGQTAATATTITNHDNDNDMQMLSSVSTAATSMGCWASSALPGQPHISSTLSGVSSPSVQTPQSSRCSSPAMHALRSDGGFHARPQPPSLTSLAAAPPTMSLTARELEQMREWQSTAEAHQQQQQQQQRCGNHHDENVLVPNAASLMPPPAPPASRQSVFGGAGRYGNAEVLSARSESLSRASATSYATGGWSDQRASTALTSLGWQGTGASSSIISNNEMARPLTSTTSSRCLSPISFSHGWGSTGPLRRGGGVQRGCLTPLSPTISPFPRSFSTEVVTPGRVDGDLEGVGDARTMEDFEDENSKRKCVESPTSSPMLASLSFSLGSSSPSLAEMLAAQPARIAVPSEAHVWEQRERRRRAVSPSLARHDDEDDDDYEANMNGNAHVQGRCYAEAKLRDWGAASGGRTGSPDCSSLVASAARTTSSSSRQPAPACSNACGRHNTGVRCGAGSSPSLAPLREATVAPSTAAARIGVVEVGADGREEDEGLSARAASLSFCSASEDEPEVDTFELERAQAVMEDADAEVMEALWSRQHRLHVHATSDFAQDLRAHGARVDASLWEPEEAEEERSGKAAAASRCPAESTSPPPMRALGDEEEERQERDVLDGEGRGGLRSAYMRELAEKGAGSSTCSPRSPLPLPPSTVTIAATTDTRCTSSATAAPSTPLTGRISADVNAFRTPPRPKRPMQHVRWGEAEDGEEVRTPGSATTCSSHSLRDVSPPVRERSMAPAELWREKEEV